MNEKQTTNSERYGMDIFRPPATAASTNLLLGSPALTQVEIAPPVPAELSGLEITADAGEMSPPVFCTLVVLLPLFYNSESHGSRAPVEREKLRQTEHEIRQMFTGYSRCVISGWWRDEITGEEFDDELVRYEIDERFTSDHLSFLRRWKRELKIRFRQKSIYFRFGKVVAAW